jgi:hypothetical protein
MRTEPWFCASAASPRGQGASRASFPGSLAMRAAGGAGAQRPHSGPSPADLEQAQTARGGGARADGGYRPRYGRSHPGALQRCSAATDVGLGQDHVLLAGPRSSAGASPSARWRPTTGGKRNGWPNFVVRVMLSVRAFARLTTRESVHTILGAGGLIRPVGRPLASILGARRGEIAVPRHLRSASQRTETIDRGADRAHGQKQRQKREPDHISSDDPSVPSGEA